MVTIIALMKYLNWISDALAKCSTHSTVQQNIRFYFPRSTKLKFWYKKKKKIVMEFPTVEAAGNETEY